MDFIRLSHLNYLRHKRTYRICTISLFISMFMILFFLSLFEGANYIVNNELQRYYEFKEITILPEVSFSINGLSGNRKLLSVEDVNDLKTETNVKSVTVDYRTSGNITQCYIDDIEVAPPDYLTGIDTSYDTFSKAKIDSYGSTEKLFSPIVAGRDFNDNDKNCALIDENSVYAYGLKNPDDIINHTITVRMDSGVTRNIKIIGVYSYKLGITPQEKEKSDLMSYTEDGKLAIYAESILVSSDVVLSLNNELENENTENYSSILIAASDMKATMSLFKTISARFFNQITCDTESINNTLDYLKLFSNVFVFLGTLLFLLAIFNQYSVITLTAEKRKKWFALQNIIGFRKMQLSLCYMGEISFALLKSFILSMTSIILTCILLNIIIKNIYSDFIKSDDIIFYPSIKISILLLIIIVIFIIGSSFIITFKISKINSIKTLCRD